MYSFFLTLSIMVKFMDAFSVFPFGGTIIRRQGIHSITTTQSHLFNHGKRRAASSLGISMVPVNSTLSIDAPPKISRFDRTADGEKRIEDECLLEIDGQRYNLTTWAKAHPGGVNVLRNFHNKDASHAFHAAAHSAAAYAMLKDFLVVDHDTDGTTSPSRPFTTTASTTSPRSTMTPELSIPSISKRPRWQQKLFTKEDPWGVHKYLGMFCLLVCFSML